MGFSETEPSIAAVVGSLDAYCARYAAEVLLQGHRVEILQARAARRARAPRWPRSLHQTSGICGQSSADPEPQRRCAARTAGRGMHARPWQRATPAGRPRPASTPGLSRGGYSLPAGPQGHGEEAAAGVLPRQRQQEARAPGLLPRRRVRGSGARAAARASLSLAHALLRRIDAGAASCSMWGRVCLG